MVIERVPPVDVQTLDKITNAIVDFAQGSYVQPLSDAKRDALVARVMDSLGCAIAACREPEVLRVARAIGFTSGGGACTALLNGVGSVEGAAFLNGMMVRYHDWNDTYVGKNGGHPSDLIPMALAVGEWCGKSGDEVLRALGAGHHLMLDMCDGSNALSRGWDHATYVGIAAVIVAGLLMDLDRPQLANALSMMAAAGNMLLARSG
jgi:2-methylcitrate dehydratase